MNSFDIEGYVRGIETENASLKEENETLRQNRMNAQKFYAVTLDIKTVASLHGLTPDTIRTYIKAGLIEAHPNSTDSKILIRASHAILLDWDELKKKYRYRN